MPWLPSKDNLISCTIDNDWEIQESSGKKPDWQFVKSSFIIKRWNKYLKISRLKIVAKTGVRLIGL